MKTQVTNNDGAKFRDTLARLDTGKNQNQGRIYWETAAKFCKVGIETSLLGHLASSVLQTAGIETMLSTTYTVQQPEAHQSGRGGGKCAQDHLALVCPYLYSPRQ